MTAEPHAGLLWPQAASTTAVDIDRVYFALLGVSLFFVLLIGGLALGYGVKYRAGSDPVPGSPISRPTVLEFVWVSGALLLTLSVFAWGAMVFVRASTVPADAQTIYVVGKQWMWKVRHPGGRREINELHVPVNTPIRLVMASEDVIHSFYVPAFRVKQDVLPGTYTTLWFKADKPGVYHLFCAEYCGALHAQMRGRVVVQDAADFQRWLGIDELKLVDGPTEMNHPPAMEPLVRFGCTECHDGGPRSGPSLAGLFGRRQALNSGEVAVVDESYMRRAILSPDADMPLGFESPSAMPSFAGQVNEDDLLDLMEAIKALPVPEDHGP